MKTRKLSATMKTDGPNIVIEVVKPKEHMGLFGTVAFGVGTMVGSGIFISSTAALEFSGSIGVYFLWLDVYVLYC